MDATANQATNAAVKDGRSERRFVGVDAPAFGGRVGDIPSGSVRVTGSTVIRVALSGAGGTGRVDDVPYALDAVADGGDQNFQFHGVGECSAELGVAPVRAESLVIVVSRQVLWGRVTAVRGGARACCAVGVSVLCAADPG